MAKDRKSSNLKSNRREQRQVRIQRIVFAAIAILVILSMIISFIAVL